MRWKLFDAHSTGCKAARSPNSAGVRALVHPRGWESREWGGEFKQNIKIRVRRRLKGIIGIRERKGKDSLGQGKISKRKMWFINDQALLWTPKGKSEAI